MQPRRAYAPTFLKQWRKHRRLTQEGLAASVDMSDSNISLLERGLIGYTQDSLEALAGALSCTPADLLIRDPGDPEGIWAVWSELTASQRQTAIGLLKALRDANP